jgi:hypothetical protein
MWAVLAIYPFLFIWQGLSISDEGNALTIYQRILSDPKSIHDTFATWGTSLAGGAWLHFFGDMGLVGVRVAGAVISLVTLLFSYLLYRKCMRHDTFLMGTLLAFLFCFHFFSPTILNYNNLSILLYAVAMVSIWYGLENRKWPLLFAAGILLGANIFVRLPNLLGLSLMLAIPFSGTIRKVSTAVQLKQFLAMSTGLVMSVFLMVLLMRMLGHDEFYIQSVRKLFESAQSDHGPYQWYNLLFPILKGYYQLLVDGTLVFLLLAGFVYLMIRFDGIHIHLKWLLLVFGAIAYYRYYNEIGIVIGGRYLSFLTAASFISLCLVAFNIRNSSHELRLASFLMLMIFITWPLGSGAGFTNYVYLVPLALPVTFFLLNEVKHVALQFHVQDGKSSGIALVLDRGWVARIRPVVLTGIILFSVSNALAYTFDDAYDRFVLGSRIDHKNLRHVFTTESRARKLESLLQELSKYVKKNDTLFVVWTGPLINYLTETRPYLAHPWTEIYNRRQLDELIGERARAGQFPVTVRYNGTSYDDILFNFLGKCSYKKAWNNDSFSIYIPPSPPPMAGCFDG